MQTLPPNVQPRRLHASIFVVLVVLILGAAIESQPADSASTAVGTEVVRTSDSGARQIVSDYESSQGNPNERSLIKGTAGLDVITVVYNAHDSITGKAGEYVLVASVRKGPRLSRSS